MIEMMLEAERALAVGLLDHAERLYSHVAAADPRNAIAVVGLARAALERDDEPGAYLLARRALILDADNPAASHLAQRIAEIMAGRGETPPEVPTEPVAEWSAEATPSVAPSTEIATATPPVGAGPSDPSVGPEQAGLLGRVFRRRR